MLEIKEDVEQALKHGKKLKAINMLRVLSSWDDSEYYIYIKDKQEIDNIISTINSRQEERVIEVYSYAKDLEEQLNVTRCWNI